MPLFIYSLLESKRFEVQLRAINGDDFRQIRCDARHFVGLSGRLVQPGTPVMAEFWGRTPVVQPATIAPQP
jgi:hypothetical protein